MTVQIATDDLTARLEAWHGRADSAVGSDIRNDALHRDGATLAQSIAIRGFVAQSARVAAHTRSVESGREVRVDSAEMRQRQHQIASAIARGLGIRIDGTDVRSDSYYTPGELTASTGRVIYSPSKPTVMLSTLPRLSVPAWKKYITDDYVGVSGSAGFLAPGAEPEAQANAARAQKQQQQHTIYSVTEEDWQEAMFSANADFNVMEAKARSARLAIEKFANTALVSGAGGLNFTSLKDQAIPSLTGSTSFAAGAALADINAGILAARDFIDETCDDRNLGGAPPNVAFIGTKLLRSIRRAAPNFASGGDMDGAMLWARLAELIGVDRIVPTPELNGFNGSASYSSMLLCRVDDDMGLRHLVGMDLAPMRSDTGLTSTKTLWCMRSAGLNLMNGLHIGLAHFQVA